MNKINNHEKQRALHAEILRILASQQSVLLKAIELERIIEREKLIAFSDESAVRYAQCSN